MIVVTETIEPNGVRCVVVKPGAPGRYPGIVAYSDIFQLTPSHLRLVHRLAGHGFVVVAPELYGRIEKPGTVLDFEADRQRALDLADRMLVEHLDADRRAVLDALRARPDVGEIGALGWCYGGHLAFRAAFEPEVKAAACCYATGVHSGKLGAADGKATSAGSLERCHEMRGELLLVWGRNDPHIPAEGRSRIHRALDEAGVRFEARHYDAEHAFMRDVGPRHDPEATDRAFTAIVELFRRVL
jgi:carboxymethylenebutenolidase